MQQAPVLTLPSGGGAPNAPSSIPLSGLAGPMATESGVKFFTAFSQAIQTILNGQTGLPPAAVPFDSLIKTLPLPGGTIDPNLLALSKTSTDLVIDAAMVETLHFELAGAFSKNLVAATDGMDPAAGQAVLADPLLGLQFEIPLELLNQAMIQELRPEAPLAPPSEETSTGVVDSAVLLKELEQAGFFVASLAMNGSTSDGSAASAPTSEGFATPAPPEDPTLSRGLLSGGGLLSAKQVRAVSEHPSLATSLLAKSGRLNVPRSVLGRFQETRLAEIAAPNPSMLTEAEAAAPGSTAEDRNATVLARLDRVEFVSRLSQALERARAQSPKAIELELNPPALGKLKLQVIEIDGQLTARIQADSVSARALLLEHMPVLDRHLGEQGIHMQKVQVESPTAGGSGLTGGGSGLTGGNNPHQSGDQQPPHQNHGSFQGYFFNEDGERGQPLTISELLSLAPGMDRLI